MQPSFLHGAAFDRVMQLIESPPEPTPALRQLMAEAYARQGRGASRRTVCPAAWHDSDVRECKSDR
jgi:hypothetical protein